MGSFYMGHAKVSQYGSSLSGNDFPNQSRAYQRRSWSRTRTRRTFRYDILLKEKTTWKHLTSKDEEHVAGSLIRTTRCQAPLPWRQRTIHCSSNRRSNWGSTQRLLPSPENIVSRCPGFVSNDVHDVQTFFFEITRRERAEIFFSGKDYWHKWLRGLSLLWIYIPSLPRFYHHKRKELNI